MIAANRARRAGSSAEAINVAERFGFVGDGRTDNTDAYMRWADHVNQHEQQEGSRRGENVEQALRLKARHN